MKFENRRIDRKNYPTSKRMRQELAKLLR